MKTSDSRKLFGSMTALGLAMMGILSLPSAAADEGDPIGYFIECVSSGGDPLTCLVEATCEVGVQEICIAGACVGTFIFSQTLTEPIEWFRDIHVGNTGPVLMVDAQRIDVGIFASQGESEGGYLYKFLGFSSHCADQLFFCIGPTEELERAVDARDAALSLIVEGVTGQRPWSSVLEEALVLTAELEESAGSKKLGEC